MSKFDTEALVIGGGATGTGIARDLAMRGFKTILVEKGDLTCGTTGRFHGLLHSGGRYVVRDPQAARECIEENHILRKIMPQCIEDTGGFFVLTDHDDPAYVPQFLEGCQTAGIPAEEVDIGQMLREEPLLNSGISRCFRLPDGAADSFLAAELNAASAREHGAQIFTYHQVSSLLQSNGRVMGAVCQDLAHDERVEISADIVVNASGAWAGRIAGMAGLQVHVIPGKGTMLAVNHRIVSKVINRCRFPSDGDILVPAHTVAIIGTTDVKVEDPDHFAIEPWEVELMLAEGEKLIRGFSRMRILRAWAGVRPLYQETSANDTRDVTRAFVLLDHEQRDRVSGLITVTGGKWTTYRKMAEVTADLACRKLGTVRPCKTHLESLPEPPYGAFERRERKTTHGASQPLAQVEQSQSFGKLICECELVTEAKVTQAILDGSVKTIDDIRRDLRVGMGPCQGGFCTYRVAGLLHQLQDSSAEQTNLALRDFLQERWKGLLPILWGQQLRQERLDELIYLSILNADHLPGPRAGRLSPVLYNPPDVLAGRVKPSQQPEESLNLAPINRSIFSGFSEPERGSRPPEPDVLVIGGGLAGLSAAWVAVQRNLRVRLIADGWGSLYWQPGCIDVLGYDPQDGETPIESPAQALPELIKSNPLHPYAKTGFSLVEQSLQEFQTLCLAHGYPIHGSIERNWLLPTALGAARPTCLAPETMIAGDMTLKTPALIVGFDAFPDFYPELIADNLSLYGIPAQGLRLSVQPITKRRFTNSLTLASLFDDPQFVDLVAKELLMQSKKIGSFSAVRVGFPAALGMKDPMRVKRRLEEALGMQVFEIPTLPPSIPGIRLSRLLIKEIQKEGGMVFNGMKAVSAESVGREISGIWSEAAARKRLHRAKAYCLACGGLLGGGLVAEISGRISEPVFDLPVSAPVSRQDWFEREFISGRSHPVFSSGIHTNARFQPLGVDNNIIWENVYVLGSALAGFDPIRERSVEGVALISGCHIGRQL